jgi:DNA-binding NarL/FixJ family response regulator
VILVVAAIDAQLVAAARSSGVRGLLLRTSSPMQIRRATRAVAAGELFFESPSPTSSARRARRPFRLTAQQMRVLDLISRGLSNKDIGAELHISEHTVKTHVTQILRKLRARDRAHAAVIALREGIV